MTRRRGNRSRKTDSAGAEAGESDEDDVSDRVRAPYGVPEEIEIFKEILALTKVKPRTLGELSGQYSGKFNERIRSSPLTPFSANKRNDGSFKRWIKLCGFELGEDEWKDGHALVTIPAPPSADGSSQQQKGPSKGEQGKQKREKAATGWDEEHWHGADYEAWDGDWQAEEWDDSNAWGMHGASSKTGKHKRQAASWADGTVPDTDISGQQEPAAVSRHTGVPAEDVADAEMDEDVPMYFFIDASAVAFMMNKSDHLFTFEGLLKLCRNGHMKCVSQQDESGVTAKENERVIFVVTDVVLDELQELVDGDLFDWLRNSPESYLRQGHEWGIVEVLSTTIHTKLLKLSSSHEKKAEELGISHRLLKLLDFTLLWESEIAEQGRVVLVTADEAFLHFSLDAAQDIWEKANKAKRRRRAKNGAYSNLEVFPCHVGIVHAQDLSNTLSLDPLEQGVRLCRSAFCVDSDAQILSAQLLSPIITALCSFRGTTSLRNELQEALDIAESLKHVLAQEGCVGATAEADRVALLQKLEDARRRWTGLL